MSMKIARERVANGVTLLDEKVPGWWRAINLEQLQMESCTHCMLGQLFGDNVEVALGAKVFGLPIRPGRAQWTELSYKFANEKPGYSRGLEALSCAEGAKIGCNRITGDANFAELKCAWAEVIAERRAAEELQAETMQVNNEGATQ